MNKKILFAIGACLLLSAAGYSQNVTYVLTDGIGDGRLKTQMESNISRLLTAINNACDRGGNEINYSGISITDDATNAIGTYWNQFHFKTEKNRYASFCVRLSGTEVIYHQGNIGVNNIVPVAGNNYSGSQRREISIYLDKNGTIVDFAFAKEKFEYEQMKKGRSKEDAERRMQII